MFQIYLRQISLKAGIFNGPQIRKLMNGHEFP